MPQLMDVKLWSEPKFGFGLKRGGSGLRHGLCSKSDAWQARFFVLNQKRNLIEYYAANKAMGHRGQGSPMGKIKLSMARVGLEREPVGGCEDVVTIVPNGQKPVTIAFDTKDEAISWVKAVRTVSLCVYHINIYMCVCVHLASQCNIQKVATTTETAATNLHNTVRASLAMPQLVDVKIWNEPKFGFGLKRGGIGLRHGLCSKSNIWRARFFVLNRKKNLIEYYAANMAMGDCGRGPPMGKIKLSMARVGLELEPVGGCEDVVTIVPNGQKPVTIAFDTKDEAISWVKAVRTISCVCIYICVCR
jgi:hypothetical protein